MLFLAIVSGKFPQRVDVARAPNPVCATPVKTHTRFDLSSRGRILTSAFSRTVRRGLSPTQSGCALLLPSTLTKSGEREGGKGAKKKECCLPSTIIPCPTQRVTRVNTNEGGLRATNTDARLIFSIYSGELSLTVGTARHGETHVERLPLFRPRWTSKRREMLGAREGCPLFRECLDWRNKRGGK